MSRIIETTLGKLRGVEMDGYTVYRGVPYGTPPVGALRWKAPQPAKPWEGVYEAARFGNIAVQELPTDDNPFTAKYKREFYSDPAFIPPMSEDCLYLNLWVPEREEGERCPVAFWIHGGGFSGGYSSELEFDGEAFCKQGVIFVSMGYRCGVFGFLAHPWLDAENPRHISGNYGILDQILALQWVHDNAAAFGGDPENITVFGQSAGAMSTQVLVSSPLTGSIPAKAILQSGIQCESDFLYCPTLAEEEQLGKRYIELTGAESLKALRAMTAEELMACKPAFDREAFQAGKGLVLVPNVDGYVLADTVRGIYRDGKMKPIPYMSGCVTDDLGSTPEELAERKPGVLLEESKRWSLKCEALGLNSYVYYFRHELPDEGGKAVPSFHSAEIWYMQGTLDRCWRPMTGEDRTVSKEMVTAWANFMRTGSPGPAWPAYRADNPFVKVF